VPVEDDMEGFGIVLLEAGQCGTPAIAARLEGIQDVIADGVNGHLVPPKDPSAYVEAIEAYRGAPEALNAAAERARQHTETTFGWSAVGDTYLSVLHSLNTKGVPPAPDESDAGMSTAPT
jgi:phosphatidylinositol alpha-1,6-mannosyltransferase